jgi:hypothetical protein
MRTRLVIEERRQLQVVETEAREKDCWKAFPLNAGSNAI